MSVNPFEHCRGAGWFGDLRGGVGCDHRRYFQAARLQYFVLAKID